jgi:NADH-quinone oxidoreductase subunit E
MKTEQVQQEVDEVVKPWLGKEGNLIMVLHQIEKRYGYMPREISFEVAKRLHIPLARIYEVITFYNYFKLEPPGKYLVSVCMGTACYLKGAREVLKAFEAVLGIKPGETTPDKLFHLQIVRCLGCCGLSPVVMIGQKVYSGVVPEGVPKIIEESQFSRQSSRKEVEVNEL